MKKLKELLSVIFIISALLVLLIVSRETFAAPPPVIIPQANGYLYNVTGDSLGLIVYGNDTIWFTSAGIYWEPATTLDSLLLDSIHDGLGRFSGDTCENFIDDTLISTGNLYIHYGGPIPGGYIYFFDTLGDSSSERRYIRYVSGNNTDYFYSDTSFHSGGDFWAHLALRSNSNVYVNNDHGDTDAVVIFCVYPSGSHHFKYDKTDLRFEMDTSLYVNGYLATVAGENIISGGDMRSYRQIFADSNIRINYNGPDGDGYLYVYHGGSSSGAYLMWDSSQEKFTTSHPINLVDSSVFEPDLAMENAAVTNYPITWDGDGMRWAQLKRGGLNIYNNPPTGICFLTDSGDYFVWRHFGTNYVGFTGTGDTGIVILYSDSTGAVDWSDVAVSAGEIPDADIDSLDPDKLEQDGAASGQVLKWNGTAWQPGTDNTAGASADSALVLTFNSGTYPIIKWLNDSTFIAADSTHKDTLVFMDSAGTWLIDGLPMSAGGWSLDSGVIITIVTDSGFLLAATAASTYETITNVANIGDDTTTWNTVASAFDTNYVSLTAGGQTIDDDTSIVSEGELGDSLDGYLLSSTASSTYETITNVGKIGDDTTNFKTAYGWGDHASQNYLDNDDPNVDTATWNDDQIGTGGRIKIDTGGAIVQVDSTVWDTAGGIDLEIVTATGFDTIRISHVLGSNIEDGEVDNGITITGLGDSTKWNIAYDSSQHDYLRSSENNDALDDVTLTDVQGACTNDFHNIGGTDDDVPDAEDYSNLSAGHSIIHSPTGTIGVDTGAVADAETKVVSGGAVYDWAVAQGYLTTETDPVYIADPAFGITAADTVGWNKGKDSGLVAWNWGDHSGQGYLTNSALSDSSITLLNATAWRVFYSNATTTAIQELALGADGTYLKSNGASAAPTWETPSGTGEVNTLSDTGTFNGTEGFGLAGGKTGTALKVKGLIEGSNITIATSGDSAYTITGSAGGWSLDSGVITTIIRDTGFIETESDPVWVGDSSGFAMKTWTQAEIGDSLNEYSLTTAIVAGYLAKVDSGTWDEVSTKTVFNQAVIGNASDSGEADSNVATRGYVQVQIEDSLNEYSLTSAISATYETITNVAKIGDDTSSWKAAAETVAAWDNRSYPDASTAEKGIAAYNSGNFSVTSGLVSMATGGVSANNILDQTIGKNDIDSTGMNFVFDGAYEGTSAVADSQYATMRYARKAAGDSVNNFSSSIWAGRVSDETGSGAWVFGTGPTISQPILTLKQGTGSTSEGVIQWHADSNTILVGTGGAEPQTLTFYAGITPAKYIDTAEVHDTADAVRGEIKDTGDVYYEPIFADSGSWQEITKKTVINGAIAIGNVADTTDDSLAATHGWVGLQSYLTSESDPVWTSDSGDYAMKSWVPDFIDTTTFDTIAMAHKAVTAQRDADGDSINVSAYLTSESGDIEGVTAGNGLEGGGTSGTVILGVRPGSGIDTTGDLVKVKPGTGIDTTGGTINHTAHTGAVTGATVTTITDDSITFLDINYGITLAGNPALGANESYFGTNGIIFEGGTADNFEGLLTATLTTSDKTWTLQNFTGTIYQTGGTDVAVTDGGTGASTLTDGGILLGSGTGAITALGVATNGQIPIGDGTTDPVLATITGTANEVTVTNGAGTITLSLPNDAGTDISADLEEETHASEHQDGGADEIAVTAGMMNAGSGASSSTFWRGDNTWSTISSWNWIDSVQKISKFWLAPFDHNYFDTTGDSVIVRRADTASVSLLALDTTIDPTFIGYVTVTGSLNEWDIIKELDVSHARCEHASSYLKLQEYYAGWSTADSAKCLHCDTSFVLHPAFMYVPEGIFTSPSDTFTNGYRRFNKRLLGAGPYCPDEKSENPHFFVKDDRYFWHEFFVGPESTWTCTTGVAESLWVPVGYADSTAKNPIYNRMDTFYFYGDDWNSACSTSCWNLQGASNQFCSDQGMFVGHDGKVYMPFRGSWTGAGADTHMIAIGWTSNGYQWSTPRPILSEQLCLHRGDTSGNYGLYENWYFMSPTILVDTGQTYVMFTIERTTNQSSTDTSYIFKWTAPKPDSGWRPVGRCEYTGTHADAWPWHMRVKRRGLGEYYAFIGEYRQGKSGDSTMGVIAVSYDDGMTWTAGDTVLSYGTEVWNNRGGWYLADGAFVDDGGEHYFELYYSAKGIGHNNSLAQTRLYFDPPNARVDTAGDGSGIVDLGKPFVLQEGSAIVFEYDHDTVKISQSGGGLTYWTESDNGDTSIFTAAVPNTELVLNDNLGMRGNNITNVGNLTVITGITVPDNSISSAELDENGGFTWTGVQDFSGAFSMNIKEDAVVPLDLYDSNVAVQGDFVMVAGATTNQFGFKTYSELESNFEAVLDLQDLQGAVTDAQVPNNITITGLNYTFNLFDPDALYAADAEICIDPRTRAALTIDSFIVTLDADPTTELQFSLKFADAFIGLASATVIDDTATVAGTVTVTGGFGDATVPANKCIYWLFDADPDDAITQASIKVYYHFD